MSERRKKKRVGTSISKAVQVLKNGGIVAFPTETFYGLAVDPFCAAAVRKLFKIKRRSSDKALILLIPKQADLKPLVNQVPVEFIPLMEQFWPGPLTLIFPAALEIDRMVTGNTGTVGIRISPHPVAQLLVLRMGGAITATSANRTGGLPAVDADQVNEIFGDGVDYILDGGKTTGGVGSTIIRLVQGKYQILRAGALDLSKILQKE